MAFDIVAARQAGLSDDTIVASLANRHNFDLEGARSAGLSTDTILSSLLSREGIGTGADTGVTRDASFKGMAPTAGTPQEVLGIATPRQRQEAAQIAHDIEDTADETYRTVAGPVITGAAKIPLTLMTAGQGMSKALNQVTGGMYPYDEQAAQANRDALQTFARDVADQTGAQPPQQPLNKLVAGSVEWAVKQAPAMAGRGPGMAIMSAAESYADKGDPWQAAVDGLKSGLLMKIMGMSHGMDMGKAIATVSGVAGANDALETYQRTGDVQQALEQGAKAAVQMAVMDVINRGAFGLEHPVSRELENSLLKQGVDPAIARETAGFMHTALLQNPPSAPSVNAINQAQSVPEMYDALKGRDYTDATIAKLHPALYAEALRRRQIDPAHETADGLFTERELFEAEHATLSDIKTALAGKTSPPPSASATAPQSATALPVPSGPLSRAVNRTKPEEPAPAMPDMESDVPLVAREAAAAPVSIPADVKTWAAEQVKTGTKELMRRPDESRDDHAGRLLTAYNEAMGITAPAGDAIPPQPAPVPRPISPEEQQFRDDLAAANAWADNELQAKSKYSTAIMGLRQADKTGRTLVAEWKRVGQTSPLDSAAHEAATSPANDLPEPTPGQIEAGNYQKGHIRLHGLDIAIENPAGSTRKGVDETGREWETGLVHHYGYIKGTVGRDKDHVDVFVKPGIDATHDGPVFVVDQQNLKTKGFDEHKVLMGFDSKEEAARAYVANYDSQGPERIDAISETTPAEFKRWLKEGDTRQPFSQAVGGDTGDAQPGETPQKTEVTGGADHGLSTVPQEVVRTAQEVPAVRSAAVEPPSRFAIDTEQDNILKAIAKLGGIDHDEAARQWGQLVTDAVKDTHRAVRDNGGYLLGRPVFNRAGRGLSIDRIGTSLAELGYLPLDQHGKWHQTDLEAAIDATLKGKPVFSHARERSSDEVYDREVQRLAEQYAELDPAEIARNLQAIDDEVERIAEGEITQEVLDGALSFFDQFIAENSQEVAAGETQAVPEGAAPEVQGTVAEKDGATEIIPFPHQADVHAESLVKTLEEAGITPDHPAHAAVLEERRQRERAPDPQTGFIAKEHFEPTMERAWQEHEATGREFAYAEIDLRNLGGLNAALGTSGADTHMRDMADIINDEVTAVSPQVQIFRKGGDEFGVLAPDTPAATIAEALAQAEKRVTIYAEENNLDTIPHTKAGKQPGVGIAVGADNFSDYPSLQAVRKSADNRVEAAKKEAHNVHVSTSGEAGTGPSGKQAGRVVSSPGQDASGSGRTEPGASDGKTVGGSNPDKSGDRPTAQGDADGTAVTTAPPEEPPTTPSQSPSKTITDFGEKIGGARKDLAVSIGPAVKKEKSGQPAWRRRYMILQDVKTEKWHIVDGETGRPLVRQSFANQEEAEEFLPAAVVAIKHRVRLDADGTYKIIRNVTDRKRVTIKDGFKTEDAAMRYLVEHAREIIETNTTFGEEIIAKPEKVFRTGAERRTGDVAPKDFDAFGFRGVEFGNWNNQAERQEVMNHAYDGLLDLAEILRIPAKAISLNGELALAFGARGQGLSGAKAHYEPGYAVINLTKMSGAGSLAHEWFHALDNYFARQDGKAKSEKVPNKRGDMVYPAEGGGREMASTGFRSLHSGVREEVRTAFKHLIEAMYYKAEQYVEDTAKAEKFVGAAARGLEGKLREIRDYLARTRDYGSKKAAATPEQLARFDELAGRLTTGQDIAVTWTHGLGAKPEVKRGTPGFMGQSRWTNDTLESMGTLYKEVTGRSGFNAERHGTLDALVAHVRDFANRRQLLEEAANKDVKTKKVPTSYRMENYKIDQGRVSDYWTTEHEMAARAFSAYVEDKVAEQGHRSDFLSYGSDNNLPWYRLFNVRPFPEGKEREALNQAFDDFFALLKTKETDKGTALYALAADHPAGVPAADLETHMAPILKNWRNAPPVRVVQSIGGLPSRVLMQMLAQGVDAADVQAVYDQGAVTLVADNLVSREEAERKLLHEIVAHHGLRAVLDPEAFRLQMHGAAIYYANHHKAEWQELAQAYGFDLRTVEGRMAAAEEMIAREAEKGTNSTVFTRIVAAIREWLRQLGFALQMGEAEIRELLAKARRFIEGQEPGYAGAHPEGAMAAAKYAVHDDIRFALRHEKEIVKAAAAPEVEQNVAKFFNPLDWSRSRAWLEDHAAPEIQRGVAWLFRNPIFEAERDPAKLPFVQTGGDRSVDRMELMLKFFGYEPGVEKERTWAEKIRDIFTWSNGELQTAWGQIREDARKLDDSQRKMLDRLLVEGDRGGLVYQTFDGTRKNPRLQGLDVETYKIYRRLRDHVDSHVAEQRQKAIEALMREGGLSEKEIAKHISDYRKHFSERQGWLTRFHGEGEHVVKVYRTVESLDWEVRDLDNGGQQAFLKYYPGAEADNIISFHAFEADAAVTVTPAGSIIVTSEEPLDTFLAETAKIIPDMILENGRPPRVLVYNHYVTTKAKARKLAAEVAGDLKTHLPHYAQASDKLTVEHGVADKISESTFGDMKSDLAVETALLKTAEKALKRGEISKEEFKQLQSEMVRDTAEVLLGRAAGRYQIRRAPYLIEGYQKENALDLYEDYMTGVAGMMSKALYAKRQFDHFRQAKPEVKPWAESYIKDSLRNMGRADRWSGTLRTMASVWYMAFRPASALINSTQIWTLGQAELSRYSDNPLTVLLKAQKDVIEGKLSQDEESIFQTAFYQVQQKETAMAEISGRNEGLGNAVDMGLRFVADKGLALFQLVELNNRKTMILAAYRAFRAQGMNHLEAVYWAMAVNNVVNFDMGRENLPGFARNAVGRTMYALQPFSFNSFNWIYNRASSGERDQMKALLRYMVSILAIGGAAAIPGLSELDKLLRRFLGKSYLMEFKNWMRRNAKKYGSVGEAIHAFAWHGILAPTAGINISNGLKQQIPFIGQMIDGEGALESAMGVFGGLAQKGKQAVQYAGRDMTERSLEALLPEGIAGPMRGYRMMTQGATTSHGKPVYDEHGKPLRYSGTDFAKRVMGFQPVEQSERMEATMTAQDIKKYWSDKRGDLMDAMRAARTTEQKREAATNVRRFNMALNGSQAKGVVQPIKADSIQRALHPKPDKKQQGWMIRNYVE